VQDVSAATDLASSVASYESEVITAVGTISDAGFTSSGGAHSQAPFATSGLPSSTMRLRLPDTVKSALDLEAGCTLTLNNTPVWRFANTTQPSAWVSNDVTNITGCPAPT